MKKKKKNEKNERKKKKKKKKRISFDAVLHDSTVSFKMTTMTKMTKKRRRK